jgi:hypothetical protein
VNSTSATKDSKRLVFQEWVGHNTVYLADVVADGTRIGAYKPFTLDEGDAIAAWTADGKTVLIVENHGDRYALLKQSLDSEVTETSVPSSAGGGVQAATLSPDEKWVLFQLWPDPGHPSKPRIMRVPLSGGSPELVLSVAPGSGFACARHPNNLCVVAEPSQNDSMIVSMLDPIHGTRGPELARYDFDPNLDIASRWPFFDLSPDGTRLAVSRGTEGPIQILSLRGKPTQNVAVRDLGEVRLFGWAGDGNGLLVVTGIKNGTVLQHVDLHGNAHFLWKCSGGQQCDWSPSPDGRRLAVLDRKMSANFWMMENF